MTKPTRRTFLLSGGAVGLGLGVAGCDGPVTAQRPSQPPSDPDPIPAAIRALKPMTAGVTPITAAEREARIEKARALMAANKIDALMLEGGSSMFYFTGVRWGLSERPFVAVIPAKGEIGWVCPGFEEQRARELVTSKDVRVWQEDESPYRAIAGILKDRGAGSGRVGVEERMRFFIANGVQQEAAAAKMVDAVAVTAGCRMIKSAAELALMQKSNDICLAAYRAAFAELREGMTQFEFSAIVAAAFDALGAPDGSAGAQFGVYTAFPHGSITPQKLKEGDVVLVDGGCSVQGYKSDITRTTVFGRPTERQIKVWNLEKAAQAAAFAAAKPGAPCEAVDAAARKVITDAGFGPDYKVPGLPHRTGHGIGLDGHEWTNFVRGNKTPLAPGMCFSDEPMIAIYGEFGIRLEDCLYITENGATFFTQPSPAIDKPFA
jgi:Xaa-Pro dipeptidase